jgi:hypothetical protein
VSGTAVISGAKLELARNLSPADDGTIGPFTKLNMNLPNHSQVNTNFVLALPVSTLVQRSVFA